MSYEVGDKVKIREDLKMYKTYNGIRASEGMTKYAGRIATIASGIGNHLGVQLDIDSGVCNWTPEMFDQDWKEDKFMKTSEFRAELKKLGYTFGGKYVRNEKNLNIALINTLHVNKIDTTFGHEISPKLFSLITKYASTPITEREDDEPKLFNVQIIKGNWGSMSWLYRADKISVSSSEDNHDLNQQWTLAQIKKYEIDDESVYKRVPVED